MTTATSVAAPSTPEAYREAIRLRTQAAAIFRRIGDRRGEGEALSMTAAAWLHIGEADSSVGLAVLAVALRLSAGDSAGAVRTLSGVLGYALERLQQGDSALAVYRRAMELATRIGDPSLAIWPTVNTGAYYFDRSEFRTALPWFHRAVDFAGQAGDLKSAAEALVNIARTYAQLGKADSAMFFARQAFETGERTAQDSVTAPTSLMLGTVLSGRGSTDSALYYYGRARDAADRAPLPQIQREARLNIGIMLVQLGQVDSARVYFTDVLERSREVKDIQTEYRALNSLGILFIEGKQLDSARAVYASMLGRFQELGIPIVVGEASVNLAKVLLQQGTTDSAFTLLRSAYAIAKQLEYPALSSVVFNQLTFAFTVLGQRDSAMAYLLEDLALTRKLQDPRGEGVSLLMMGLLTSLNRDFGTAVAYFDSAATIKGRLAVHAGGDFNRTSLGEKEFDLFDVWAKAWLERSPAVGQRVAAAAALGASERGRTQALLDLMGRTADSVDRADLSGWAVTLVRDATKGGNSVLIYHATPDTLLAWTAGPGLPIAAHVIPIERDSLSRMVARLRQSMGLGGDDGRMVPEDEQDRGRPGEAAGPWTESAASLAKVLLPPSIQRALSPSRNVLVIPHGPVALVPFTILPWGGATRVFGARTALRYSPSLGAALAAEARPVNLARASAVVVGNPEMPTVELHTGFRVQLNALPKAELEAQTVGAQLGSGTTARGGTTETAIRGRLPGAALVHLATHGFAFSAEARARNSYLALTPDSLNDGLLTVGEILDDPALTLSADLVTLSACQTGLGDLKRAEGTIGLQRAFLARGARSVLVSLWSVSDEATRLLMERFYAHWLGDSDHPGKAESLRRAQEDVRVRPGFEHPRYWAAFQLVGAP